MTIRYKTYAAYAALLTGLAVIFAAVSHTRAGEGCCGSKTTASTRTEYQPAYGPAQPRLDSSFRPPHGGQLSKTLWHHYEVIYGAQETRLYLYDIYHGPVSTRSVQGQAVMSVRSSGKLFRYPLRHVPVERGQDYLVAMVDVTRVENGDMDVDFELAGLPNREGPTAQFSQVFARMPTGSPPVDQLVESRRLPLNNEYKTASVGNSPVSVTQATAADHPAVVRQHQCPVMGAPLGEHGTPIKVVVDGRAIFVCCRGCVDTVVENPEFHFQRLASGGPAAFPQGSPPAKKSCH